MGRAAMLLAAVALLAIARPAWTQTPGYLFPGTNVSSDSIRITALGTGTPSVQKKQVSTSYLLQLGDGQVFLFDVGTDSIQNLYATSVDLSTVTKVFLSHLHSDHITDLAPLYAIANGRQQPLQIWGPSGAVPATGTNATVEGLKAFLGWDQVSRNLVSEFPANYTGNQVVAHEFLYNQTNALIYNQSGVAVYSNPAFHYDTPGPVSLKLVWNNITIVYSGDTIPLQSFVNFAQGADVVIHESVGPIEPGYLPKASANIASNHTTQAEVGQIFQALQPRLAVATHLSLNDHNYVPIISGIRSTYPSGPLSIASDLQAWTISPTTILQQTLYTGELISGFVFSNGSTDPAAYTLDNDDVAFIQRPPTVQSLGLQLAVFQPNASAGAPTSSAG